MYDFAVFDCGLVIFFQIEILIFYSLIAYINTMKTTFDYNFVLYLAARC